MSLKATMPLVAMYQYDETLFSQLMLPDKLNRDFFIAYLLLDAGDIGLLRPDFCWMKWAIGVWSLKNIENWIHLVETTEYDYNPIHNYDRTETFEETSSNDRSEDRTVKETSERTDDYSNSGEDVTTTQTSAYDTEDFLNSERTSVKLGTGNNLTSDANRDMTDGVVGKESGTIKRTLKTEGNIGVTTTQQMIQAERDIALFSIYDVIVESFKENFCLLVY